MPKFTLDNNSAVRLNGQSERFAKVFWNQSGSWHSISADKNRQADVRELIREIAAGKTTRPAFSLRKFGAKIARAN